MYLEKPKCLIIWNEGEGVQYLSMAKGYVPQCFSIEDTKGVVIVMFPPSTLIKCLERKEFVIYAIH